ncbi:MAG: cellulose binding domain-containing protein, partial [Cyclobacteriaceae bacterium]
TATVDIEVKAVQLSVLHKNADSKPTNNIIKPFLRIANQGDDPLPYEKITLRYWLTVEDFAPMTNLAVYWAKLGTRNVQMNYVALAEPRQGALGYVEYTIDASAGELAANANSGPIQTAVAKQNWTPMNEADDYSYAVSSNYIANDRITAYYNGLLVWGSEPTVVPAVQSLTVYSKTKSSATANTIGTLVQVRNEGNGPISYEDLTVRYWFTADGEQAVNFYLDYAKLGRSSISGEVVRLDVPVAGADRYLELSFSSALGSLSPLSTTGNIQYRMAKSNWSAFDQTDDHSYLPRGPMRENMMMTVYLDGELVYGTEPIGATARQATAPSKEVAGKETNISESLTDEAFLDKELDLKVFPNPVQNWVNIEFSGTSEVEQTHVLIYNLSGKLMQQQVLNSRERSHQLDVRELPQGAYLMQVEEGQRRKTLRLLKE